jgi:hypothetical protein
VTHQQAEVAEVGRRIQRGEATLPIGTLHGNRHATSREQVKGVGLGSLRKHQRVGRDVDIFQYAHQAGDINPGEGSEKRYPTQERFDGVCRRERAF